MIRLETTHNSEMSHANGATPNATAWEQEFDFDAWGEEVAEIDMHEVARQAFDGILTLDSTNEQPRTIYDVQNDIRTFLGNEAIRQLEAFVDYVADSFEAFCGHNNINSLNLDSDIKNLQSFNEDNGHNHSDVLEAKHDHKEDDDESDDKKSKKKIKRGWLALLGAH